MSMGTPIHPVLELLRTRAAASSVPGQRDDGHSLALAIEGGGMRGVVAAAMAAVIERDGLTNCFDLIVGTSAGAFTGAALLSGVAEAGADSYHQELLGRGFIMPYKLLIGRPAFNPAFSLELVNERFDQGRHQRVLDSPIALYCVAVDVKTTKTVALRGMRTTQELRAALLASGRIPWIGGDPVEYKGRRYVDGGLGDPIPFRSAIENGATHVLALQTRPWGLPRSTPGLADRMLRRKMRRLNPQLAELYDRRIGDYERDVNSVAELSSQLHGPLPAVLGWRLKTGSPVPSQLSRNAQAIKLAGEAGRAHADEALAVAFA